MTIAGLSRTRAQQREVKEDRRPSSAKIVSIWRTQRCASGRVHPATAERYARFVDSTRIERRFTMVPVVELLQLHGVQSRNDAYIPHALAVGEQAARRALDAAPAGKAGPTTLISLRVCAPVP